MSPRTDTPTAEVSQIIQRLRPLTQATHNPGIGAALDQLAMIASMEEIGAHASVQPLIGPLAPLVRATENEQLVAALRRLVVLAATGTGFGSERTREIAAERDQVREAKRLALDEQRFEDAANIRDQERKLTQRLRDWQEHELEALLELLD